ncbi:hypothetical protein OS493_019514 [Desmophyllum pertusum]|uniref:Uncharacterized protein n=1 Tax=Desmophyllum pertusum TaxID=174260 RepID=A0A9X0D2I8_9CNID|nr:hypothetical protein OS493_019514 [Desmophyllum pertusum]
MAEEARNIRRTAKGRFTRKRNELIKSIENESGIEIIESNYASLVEAWSIVETIEAKERTEAEHTELQKREREQIQRMIDQSLIKRDTAQAVFETLYKSATHMLETETITTSVVKKFQIQMEEAFTECKRTNSALLELLTRESADSQME